MTRLITIFSFILITALSGDVYANQPQLVIEANASQTDDVIIIRNSASAEKLTISKDGLVTATGLTLGVTHNITWGTKTLDHDGTDFVFNDDVAVDGLKLGSTEYITMGVETFRHDATDFLFSDTIAIPGIVSTAADGEHGANFSNSGAPTGGEQETEGAFTYNRTTDKLEVWDGSDRNKYYISNEDDANIRWLIFNLVEAGTDCATATNIAGDFESPIAGTILQSDSSPFYIKATNSTAGINTGVGLVVDVSIGGTSIMTTNKLDFATTEKTTTTAATKPDLTTTALAVGDIITIDIDSIHDGTVAKGLTVYIPVREN